MKIIIVLIVASSFCFTIESSPTNITISWLNRDSQSPTGPTTSPIQNFDCIRKFASIVEKSTSSSLISDQESFSIESCSFSDDYSAITINENTNILSLIEISGGELSLTNCQFKNIYIACNSLIHFASTSTGLTMNNCIFRSITIWTLQEISSSTIIPCAVIYIQIPKITSTASVGPQISILESQFEQINLGYTEGTSSDNLQVGLDTISDFAPIIIEIYPNSSETENYGTSTCELKRCQFQVTQGSHSGAITIHGNIGTIRMSQSHFIRTVAEFGTQYIDAVYAQVLYMDTVDMVPSLIQANFIQCYADTTSPQVAIDGGSDDISGAFEDRLKVYNLDINVDLTGRDQDSVGTTDNPFRTLSGAVWASNMKQSRFLEGNVDNGRSPVTIKVNEGFYEEERIKIYTETAQISGKVDASNDWKTNISNIKVNTGVSDACLITIPVDNEKCLLSIMSISFHQIVQFATNPQPTVNQYGFLEIGQGIVSIINCRFQQENVGTPSMCPMIHILCPGVIMEKCLFQNAAFKQDASADISSEAVLIDKLGGVQLLDCSFTSITGMTLRAKERQYKDDLIFSSCSFTSCTTDSNSPIVIESVFERSTDAIYIHYAAICTTVTFTKCQFTNCIGDKSGAVELLGTLIIFSFTGCQFNSNSGNTARNVYINLEDATSSTNIYGSQMIPYSFGGCTDTVKSGSSTYGIYSSDQSALDFASVISADKNKHKESYVRTSGSDANEGTSERPYATIAKALLDSNAGPDQIIQVTIGRGVYDDDFSQIGARGVLLIGNGTNSTVLQNQIALQKQLACIVGGSLELQSLSVNHSSINKAYGGLIIMRGAGQLIMKNLIIQQNDAEQEQITSIIYATAGDIYLENVSVTYVKFSNSVQQTSENKSMYAAAIYCTDFVGNVVLNGSSFSQMITYDKQSPLKNVVDYEGGAIVIESAHSFSANSCRFSQIDGWRVGAIIIRKLTVPNITISNCVFDHNRARMNDYITDLMNKIYVGSDLVLDHEFIRSNIDGKITNSSSTSTFPLIGSIHDQFCYGVFDYMLRSLNTDSLYVSNNGSNEQGTGEQTSPFKTIEYAISVASSSADRQAVIMLEEGVFSERLIMIGGRLLGFQGVSQRDDGSTTNSSTDQPGLTQLSSNQDTGQDFFTVYNGSLSLTMLVLTADNSDSMSNKRFYFIHLYGQESRFTSESCIFLVSDPKTHILCQYIMADNGANISMKETTFQKIITMDISVMRVSVYSNPLSLTNVTFSNNQVQKVTAGSLKIEQFDTGTVLLEGCNFQFCVSLTDDFWGTQIFGAGITLIFNSQAQSGQVTFRECRFDTCVGDCCGALTVQGPQSCLNSGGLVFQQCLFISNIACSSRRFPDAVRANDIYFDIPGFLDFIQSQTDESAMFSGCTSLSNAPQINIKSNEDKINLDRYLVTAGSNSSQLIHPKDVIVSGSKGSDSNTGGAGDPIKTIQYGYSFVSKGVNTLSTVTVELGIYHESLIQTSDCHLVIKGRGYHNTIDFSFIWSESGTDLTFSDMKVIQCPTDNTGSPTFDVSPGAYLMIKRCVLTHDQEIENMDEATRPKYKSPFFRMRRASGGLFSVILHSATFDDTYAIHIDAEEDDFDWDDFRSDLLPFTSQDQCNSCFQYSTSSITCTTANTDIQNNNNNEQYDIDTQESSYNKNIIENRMSNNLRKRKNSRNDDGTLMDPLQMDLFNLTVMNVYPSNLTRPIIKFGVTPRTNILVNNSLFYHHNYIEIALGPSVTEGFSTIGAVRFTRCRFIKMGEPPENRACTKVSPQTCERPAVGAILVYEAQYGDDRSLYATKQPWRKNCQARLGQALFHLCFFSECVGEMVDGIAVEKEYLKVIPWIIGDNTTISNSNFLESHFIRSHYWTGSNSSQTIRSGLSIASVILEARSDEVAIDKSQNYELLLTSGNDNFFINVNTEEQSQTLSQISPTDVSIEQIFGGDLLSQRVYEMSLTDQSKFDITLNKGIYEELCIVGYFGEFNVKSSDGLSQTDVIIRGKNSTSEFVLTDDGYFVDPYFYSLISLEIDMNMTLIKLTLEHFNLPTEQPIVQIRDRSEIHTDYVLVRPSTKSDGEVVQRAPTFCAFSGLVELKHTIIEIIHLEAVAIFKTMHEDGMDVFPYDRTEAILTNSGIINVVRNVGIGTAGNSIGFNLTFIDCDLTHPDNSKSGRNSYLNSNNQSTSHTNSNSSSHTHTHNHKYSRKDSKLQQTKFLNEGEEGEVPEPPLVPSCGWESGYIRMQGGNLRIEGKTDIAYLRKGGLSLFNTTVFLGPDVRFHLNKENVNIPENQTFDALSRKNIACGWGASIEASFETFNEEGLESDALWIHRTNEGEGLFPAQCELKGEIAGVTATLFKPTLSNVVGDLSKDKQGSDITFIGHNLIKCEMIKYQICEKPGKDGIIDETHCMKGILEAGALKWDNEVEATVQTRFKVVRKWKTMRVKLMYANVGETESFDVSIEKMTTGMIALMVILTVIILAVSIGGLITVYLYYRYRQHKIEDARKKELQEMGLDRQSYPDQMNNMNVSNEYGISLMQPMNSDYN